MKSDCVHGLTNIQLWRESEYIKWPRHIRHNTMNSAETSNS